MEYYYKHCKEHELKARYCPEEKRWICEKCKPEQKNIVFINVSSGK